MRKYLREIEVSGLILVIIGIVCSWIWGAASGMWPCAVGLLCWLVTLVYKAFHWETYARENKQNIVIMLLAILLLTLRMLFK